MLAVSFESSNNKWYYVMKDKKHSGIKGKSEDKFLSIFENSISAIIFGAPDGSILDANSAAAEMFGYTKEELKALGRGLIFDMKDPKMVAALKTREETGKAKGELIGIRKNGQRFPCEFSSAIFKSETGESRTSTVLNDITERKKAEEDVALLLNNTEESFVLVDRNLVIISFNKQFKTLYEKLFNKVVIKGDCILSYAHDDRKELVKNIYEKVFNGQIIDDEIVIFSNNQKRIIFSIRYKPAFDNYGNLIGAFVTSTDVTEKKLSQLKLEESYDLLEKLTSKVPIVIFQFKISLDGKMSFPFVSHEIKKLNPNLNIELLKQDASSAFATVHPEDLEKLLVSIDQSKNNLTDWELEYRSIVDEDSTKWIKGKSSPEKMSDGSVVWFGYFQDITEQKISNEKIRISKERYDIIAKATNDTIWDRDLITNTIKWNKGIVGIFGYKNEESEMDVDWWFSKIHPEDVDIVRKNLESLINKKETRWENEYRFCCADGTYKYVHDRGFLVVNDSMPVRMIGAMQDITERKRAEGKYRESERRFKTIFEAEPECVKLIGCKGELLEMNSAGLALLEVDSVEQVNTHSLIEFVLPEYREAFNNLHQLAMNGKDSWMELEIIGLLGTHRWLETKTVPIRDENDCVTMMLSVTRDITKRKQEEYHLKLLESVITNANDAVVITEAEPFEEPGPRIVFVNEAFTTMTGYSEEEVIGKSPRFLRGVNSDRKELKRLGDAIKKFEPCEITTINYKKNGDEFWINLSVSPVSDEKGKVTHWISIERDITHRKYYEIEREQIIAELSQNNKDLKQFSYVISHNLRAPIANLLGLTSLIDQFKIPNKTLKQMLDGIKQSAIMFDETIKDLSKVLVVKDQTNIAKEELSLVVGVDRALAQLSIAVNDNDVKINYEFKRAQTVSFISSYLESIFINLFTNALKYKSHQRKLKIDITSEDKKEYVVVKFKDNGIGIDVEKHREKLFKLYQRFHDNSEGKGLGLYLVKSQMEALGGTIDVESVVGKGTTFILKFKK